MRGINKVIIVGTAGKDPDLRYSSNGNAITNISLATNEEWKDKSGQQQSSTEWHNVVFFGKLAEIAGKYLTKGSQVYIEGKLKTEKYQDKSGQDKYSTKVEVDSFNGVMQMLGVKQEKRQSSGPNSGHQAPQQNNQPAKQPQPQQDNSGFDDNFDDDIPF